MFAAEKGQFHGATSRDTTLQRLPFARPRSPSAFAKGLSLYLVFSNSSRQLRVSPECTKLLSAPSEWIYKKANLQIDLPRPPIIRFSRVRSRYRGCFAYIRSSVTGRFPGRVWSKGRTKRAWSGRVVGGNGD